MLPDGNKMVHKLLPFYFSLSCLKTLLMVRLEEFMLIISNKYCSCLKWPNVNTVPEKWIPLVEQLWGTFKRPMALKCVLTLNSLSCSVTPAPGSLQLGLGHAEVELNMTLMILLDCNDPALRSWAQAQQNTQQRPRETFQERVQIIGQDYGSWRFQSKFRLDTFKAEWQLQERNELSGAGWGLRAHLWISRHHMQCHPGLWNIHFPQELLKLSFAHASLYIAE